MFGIITGTFFILAIMLSKKTAKTPKEIINCDTGIESDSIFKIRSSKANPAIASVIKNISRKFFKPVKSLF
jgi:hypothetical protein